MMNPFPLIKVSSRSATNRVAFIMGLPPRLTSFWIISSQIYSNFLKSSNFLSNSPFPTSPAGRLKQVKPPWRQKHLVGWWYWFVVVSSQSRSHRHFTFHIVPFLCPLNKTKMCFFSPNFLVIYAWATIYLEGSSYCCCLFMNLWYFLASLELRWIIRFFL